MKNTERSVFLIVQCLSLKCRPQHGGWQWQPLIAQVPAGKSKAMLPLHGGLQLSKITKKNNHIPYSMRCWKCCPPSSTHFWQLFRKCSFTRCTTSWSYQPYNTGDQKGCKVQKIMTINYSEAGLA